MDNADYDRIVDNIATMIEQTDYTIDEICEVVNEMKKDIGEERNRYEIHSNI